MRSRSKILILAIIFAIMELVFAASASATAPNGYWGEYYDNQDGNVTVYWNSGFYDTGTIVQSGPANNCSGRLNFQSDGNLVERGYGGVAKWASNTAGHPNSFLAAQSDGNVVIYQRGTPNTVLWSSHTNYAGGELYWFGTDSVGHFLIFSSRSPSNYGWYPDGESRAESQLPGGTVTCGIVT